MGWGQALIVFAAEIAGGCAGLAVGEWLIRRGTW